MEHVTVINTSECRRELRIARPEGEDTESIHLEIGANLVRADLVADARKNPFVDGLFARGILRTDAPPKADEDFRGDVHKVDLSKLKYKAALKAIEACADPRQLRSWIDQDPRPDVRKAILERHRVLVPATEANSEPAPDAQAKSPQDFGPESTDE